MNTDLFSGIRRERRPRSISRRSLGRSGCGAVAVTVRFDPSLTLMMMSIDSLQAAGVLYLCASRKMVIKAG